MTSAQEDSMTSPQRSLAGGLLLTSILLLLFFTPTDSFAIPVFARKYGLPCSACHEAWPKLNSFGQKFKDEGYQLRNEKDAPIWLRPEFWPVAMRITPNWHFESAGRTPVDSAPSGEQTINTSGFDLTGIDILTGGTLGLPFGRSYDGYLHLSQGFLVPHLGLQRVGVYGWAGLRPTFFLTTDGVPIPGAGRGNRSFYRAGVYGSVYIGKFDVTGVYQRAGDNVFLANATSASPSAINQPTVLPVGAQGPQWNTGTIEAHYTYSPQLFIIGRYELVRISRQVLASNPSDFGNVDVFTIGYRYYPFMHSRDGLAWHQEFATENFKGLASSGRDQRFSSYFMGFDFAF